ncbi:hypothetical protein HXZ62_12725 [Empedobacter falsenii]|uniref:hypothetical protein n=1 Tax=Empedobacter falsenii TaxID=343874 RepID=UPI002575100C|nr:hypothetical protein [Empedobacter falsenii]MDM1063415.1 hypothetical protein [Empedobacter falsenii]
MIPLLGGKFLRFNTDDPIEIINGANKVTSLTLDKEGKNYIEINLSWGLNNLFNETVAGFNSEEGELELYFDCSYEDQKVKLPDSFGDYLKVKRSEQNLFIQPACPGYNFPEIRTYNGDIVIFKEDVIEVDENNQALDPVKEHLEDKRDEYLKEKIAKKFDKRRRVIAIEQLQKGKLVTNTGLIKFRKNIYTNKNITNLGEEIVIKRASNMGWRGDGKLVTTRGISQIDYFENIGLRNGAYKVAKELLNVFDFLDLIKFMSGNGKPDFLPTGFAPLDLIVQLILTPVLQQMKEMEEDIINDILEQSKDNGVAGIKNFIGTRANVTNYNNLYTNEDDEKIYDLIEITQETYNKLMMGEFKTLRSLKDYDKQLEEENKKLFYQGKIQKLENNKNYTILYKWQDDKSINDQIIVIETIFTKC